MFAVRWRWKENCAVFHPDWLSCARKGGLKCVSSCFESLKLEYNLKMWIKKSFIFFKSIEKYILVLNLGFWEISRVIYWEVHHLIQLTFCAKKGLPKQNFQIPTSAKHCWWWFFLQFSFPRAAATSTVRDCTTRHAGECTNSSSKHPLLDRKPNTSSLSRSSREFRVGGCVICQLLHNIRRFSDKGA